MLCALNVGWCPVQPTGRSALMNRESFSPAPLLDMPTVSLRRLRVHDVTVEFLDSCGQMLLSINTVMK